jgi:hypothetical protein
MIMKRLFHLSVIIAAVAALSACGGGGGGDGSSTNPGSGGSSGGGSSGGGSTATVSNVKVTHMDLAASDVLVKTTAKPTTVASSIGTSITNLFSSAMAVNLPQLNVGVNNGFTNKLVNGNLVSLNPVITTTDGTTLTCDTSNAEVTINSVWLADKQNKHLLINATLPSKIDSSCNVTYDTGNFIVTGTGAVYSVDLPSDTMTDLIPAHDDGFNTSDSVLFYYSSGMVRALDIGASSATLTDLTDSALPLASGTGRIAYNGQYLVGLPSDRHDAALVFERSSKSFKIVPENENPMFPLYPGQAVMIAPNGEFVWNWGAGIYKKIDVVNGTYSNSYLSSLAMPNGMYGGVGRSGPWLLSDRCVLWNTETGDVETLGTYDTAPHDAEAPLQYAGDYVRMVGSTAYCVNHNKTLFVRYNTDTNAVSALNTDTLGYYTKGLYTMFEDHALVEVVNTVNSDHLYLELNFDSNTAIQRGLISNGDRQVVDLITLN